jgi:hypothetical protein
MKFGYFLMVAGATIFLLSACNVEQELEKITVNPSKTCVDGVTYLQFTSGATVQLDINGKPVACK